MRRIEAAQSHPEARASGGNAPAADLAAAPAARRLELVEGLERDDLAYLRRRYEEEMRAGQKAQTPAARIAHYDLAYRYALRARDSRANIQL